MTMRTSGIGLLSQYVDGPLQPADFGDGRIQQPLHADALVFFIDETGHENLKQPNYPFFGMGGVAISLRNYKSTIAKPWRDMKRTHFGGATKPMHATHMKFERRHITALNGFFARRFYRFGAITTEKLEKPIDMDAYEAVFHALRGRFDEIGQRVPASEVAIIMEGSQRLDALAEKHFSTLGFSTVDGESVHTHLLRMTKASREPGLEVADFVAHTMGRQQRHWHCDKIGLVPDFDEMFAKVPAEFRSFISVSEIQINDSGIR